MMKRLLAAVFVAASVLTLTAGLAFASANSQFSTPHLTSDPITFRTHKAALGVGVSGFSGYDNLGGYADSSIASRVGTAISILDTTTLISTAGWPTVANQSLTDTSGVVCTLNVSDANGTGCQTGMDSLYVAVQGSVDNLTWVTLRTFKNGTISSITDRLSQVNVTGAFQGLLTLNGASLANGPPVWRYTIKQRAANGFEGVDVSGAQSWPLLRFIVGFPDAGGYIVKATVTHLTDKE